MRIVSLLPSATDMIAELGNPPAGEPDDSTSSILAPGVEGEFGVLPGHVAFISALKPGVLTVREGSRRDVFAVGPGYLQVGLGGDTRILVQEAVLGADVDTAEARAAKARAPEELRKLAPAAGAETSQLSSLQGRLAWAQAQLDAHTASGGRPRE